MSSHGKKADFLNEAAFEAVKRHDEEGTDPTDDMELRAAFTTRAIKEALADIGNGASWDEYRSNAAKAAEGRELVQAGDAIAKAAAVAAVTLRSGSAPQQMIASGANINNSGNRSSDADALPEEVGLQLTAHITHNCAVSFEHFATAAAAKGSSKTEDPIIAAALNKLVGGTRLQRCVDPQKEFDPVPVIRTSDTYGRYSFDPMQGIAKVRLVRNDGRYFYGRWKGEVTAVRHSVAKGVATATTATSATAPTKTATSTTINAPSATATAKPTKLDWRRAPPPSPPARDTISSTAILNEAAVARPQPPGPALESSAVAEEPSSSSSSSSAPLAELDLRNWVERLFRDEQRALAGVDKLVEALQGQGIESVQTLLEASKETLEVMRHNAVGAMYVQLLLEKRDLYDDSGVGFASSASTPSSPPSLSTATAETPADEVEQRANLHKVRRFFYFHAGRAKEIELINRDCVIAGLRKFGAEFRNDSVLEQLRQDFLKPFYTFGDFPRGLLLFGPPGTGKTELIKCVATNCGLHSVTAQVITAAELNRSYVGQSEQLIRDIFNRARLTPHLACIVPIDEIDSAVPKRDDTGGGNQHGADKVTTFLGLLEGGSDVPNAVLIGTSNRREAIDKPIRRRLRVQIFVGFPDTTSRRGIIEKKLMLPEVPAHIACQPGRPDDRLAPRDFFGGDFVRRATEMTMNFSGAAVGSLCKNLMAEWCDYYMTKDVEGFKDTAGRLQKYDDTSRKGQFAALAYHARAITEAFDLKLGTMYICDLLSSSSSSSSSHRGGGGGGSGFSSGKFTTAKLSGRLVAPETVTNATGLILADMRETDVADSEELGLGARRRGLELHFEQNPQLATPSSSSGAADSADARGVGDDGGCVFSVKEVPLRPYCSVCQKYVTQVCCGAKGAKQQHVQDETNPARYEPLSVVQQRFKRQQHAGRNVGGGINNNNVPEPLSHDQLTEMLREESKAGLVTTYAPPSLDQLLREAVGFAQARRLTRISLLNMSNFVLVGGATNEARFIEELATELKQAAAKGSRTLLIVDLDSIASVQTSTSEGSFGSRSTSIANRQLFDIITEQFLTLRRNGLFPVIGGAGGASGPAGGGSSRTSVSGGGGGFRTGSSSPTTSAAATADRDAPPLGDSECWCMMVIRDANLMAAFRERTGWPLSNFELYAMDRRATRASEQTCVECKKQFIGSRNDFPGECRYHPGKLMKLGVVIPSLDAAAASGGGGGATGAKALMTSSSSPPRGSGSGVNGAPADAQVSIVREATEVADSEVAAVKQREGHAQVMGLPRGDRDPRFYYACCWGNALSEGCSTRPHKAAAATGEGGAP